MKPQDSKSKIQDLMKMSLVYVIVCLVRDELDVKYYVNLWENELKGIYYGGDYHTGSPNLKVKQFVCCFLCLLSAIVCSILVLLWARVIHCTKFW